MKAEYNYAMKFVLIDIVVLSSTYMSADFRKKTHIVNMNSLGN